MNAEVLIDTNILFESFVVSSSVLSVFICVHLWLMVFLPISGFRGESRRFPASLEPPGPLKFVLPRQVPFPGNQVGDGCMEWSGNCANIFLPLVFS